MSKERLLTSLIARDCAVHQTDLFSGKFGELIELGLRVLTLCYDGSGRSKLVADALTCRHGIPAVRLVGGIGRISGNPDLQDSIPSIISIVNTCPTIAVILTPEEILRQYVLIAQLRAL